MSIDWKSKLSSRKLWIGLALVVIGIILCITGDISNGMKLIATGGIGYLGAECIVDVARAIWPSGSENEVYTIELEEPEDTDEEVEPDEAEYITEVYEPEDAAETEDEETEAE